MSENVQDLFLLYAAFITTKLIVTQATTNEMLPTVIG